MRGRAIKLSGPRRLVGDLMKFSMSVPRVTVQRHMNIASLLQARSEVNPRPSWTAIFLKGYGLLGQDFPELRRAYIKFPLPHLYEYPKSVASVAHEREHEGERAVLLARIRAPEERKIPEIERLLHTYRNKPVLQIKEFRRALRLARLPTPVRRAAIWLGLNLARQRANFFGTFQFSVYSALGAESLNPLTPLTTLFNYGQISSDGWVTVRIHYDHRVMDGANVARALVRFEEILNTKVVGELRNMTEEAR
ncbi:MULTISPECIES: hypothetical protein [Chelativorans]|nr:MULTISPECIES: hypothetical protein [Chelativorans]